MTVHVPPESVASPIRALTLMGKGCGDLTLTWTEDQDADMEKKIAAMMANNVTFFIIKPRLDKPATRTKLLKAAMAKKHRSLLIPDESLQAFFEAGKGILIATPDEKTQDQRLSRDPAEVAKNESIATPQHQAG